MTDLFTDLTVVDRSTLERYATCPAQARLCETAVRSVHSIAESGEQAHRAIGQLVASYIDSGGFLSPSELQEELRVNLRSARPDVQPDVVDSVLRSTYRIVQTLTSTNPLNILRFDGGEAEQSGQLAADIESLGMRYTSEIDLLLATPSKRVLDEWDWKTGHKHWTVHDIAQSFQFQSHAWLVFQNYPEVEQLNVRVFNTRSGYATWETTFGRDEMRKIEIRIRSAAGEWFQYHEADPKRVPAWPARDKCSLCDAAALCPVVDQDIADVHQKPGEFLDQLCAIKERVKAMEKLAGAYVESTGRDIVSPTGVAFGFNKPPGSSKPRKAFYELDDRGENDEF